MKAPIKLLTIAAAISASMSLDAATILTPDSATTNAPALSNRGIDETINGSGFDTSAANITDWYHDQNKASDGNFYYIGDRNNITNSDVEFTFSFDTAVTVDTVHFWTYDRAGDSPGREIKDFDISFSTDNGSTFSSTISLSNWLDRNGARITVGSPGNEEDKIGHQSRAFTSQSNVTDIKFSNVVTHNASERYVAFSEVRFSQVPEPGTALLGGLGFLMLLRRRRR